MLFAIVLVASTLLLGSSIRAQSICGCKAHPLKNPGANQFQLSYDAGETWSPGTTLKIQFLGGSVALQTEVRQIANEWTKFANINFEFKQDGNSDIRIAFDKGDGHWSKLGTQARRVASNGKTMNLDIDSQTPKSVKRRVVLHEFGHALGLHHEQFSPNVKINWNRKAVIKYYSGAPNFWDLDEIEFNVLTPPKDTVAASGYDPDSVMHYTIPAWMTTDGYTVTGKSDISPLDALAIHAVYPFSNPSPNRNYILQHKLSSKFISTGDTENGKPFKIWTGVNRRDVKRYSFTLESAGDGYFFLRHLHSKKYLSTGKKNNGDPLIVWEGVSTKHKARYRFKLFPSSLQGYYYVKHEHSGKFLSCPKATNGTPIVLWGIKGNSNDPENSIRREHQERFLFRFMPTL